MAAYQNATVPPFVHVTGIRRGRCGLDPFDLITGQVVEAPNVDGYDGLIGRKRPGAESVSLTGGTAFTGPMNALARWVPGTDETQAQLLALDSAGLMKTLNAGTSFADVALYDAISSRGQDTNFAALNGKEFIGYNSAQPRLHVLDPAAGMYLRFLFVGSGGTGGNNSGGGGAGGNVIEGVLEGLTLGTLTITLNGVGVDSTVTGLFTLTAAAGQSGAAVAGAGGNSALYSGGAGSGTQSGGGGAGARANGAAGLSGPERGGNGGVGVTSDITGVSQTYGDGGGGGTNGAGTIGAAGGTSAGAGGQGANGANAAANRGGGGGGGGLASAGGVAGSAGLYLRFKTGSITFSTTGSITTTTIGGDTLITFTGSGSFTILTILPVVRRVGLAPGANGPSVFNQGLGTYAATIRYYRVRWLDWDGAVLVRRRSEPTPATAFTPSGAGAQVVVQCPNRPNEGENAYEIEASADGTLFYVLRGINGLAGGPVSLSGSNGIIIGDGTAVGYTSGSLSDPSGYYTLPPACLYVTSDGNRLVMTGDPVAPSRVYFTPVLGSADKGDDERLVITSFQKNYLDVGTKDGGGIVGLSEPINGVIYVFKSRAVWALTPTGNVTGPYLFRKVRSDIGCLHQKTIRLGRDASGNVCVYFWDALTGPWRVSAQNGFEYLGRDVEDVTPTVNLTATNMTAHAVWHPRLHQYWVWLAVSGANDPTVKLAYDPLQSVTDDEGLVRGGWYYHTGDSCNARCAAMFANTLGSSMSLDLKPYAGLTTGTAKVYKCDSDTATDDAGAAFQSYWDTGVVLPPLQEGTTLATGDPVLVAKATPYSVQLTVEGNFNPTTNRTSLLDLTAAGSETRVFRKFLDCKLSGLTALQVRIGDASAQSAKYTLDRLSVPIQMENVP